MSGLIQTGESCRGAHDPLQSHRGLLARVLQQAASKQQECCAQILIDRCIRLSSGTPVTRTQTDRLARIPSSQQLWSRG